MGASIARGRMVFEVLDREVRGDGAWRGTVLSRQVGGGWLVDWENGVRSIHAECRLVSASKWAGRP